MQNRSFRPNKSFDPETLTKLSAVFEGVCADLGVHGNARCSLEIIADRVVALADSHSDPDALRAAVIASLTSRH